MIPRSIQERLRDRVNQRAEDFALEVRRTLEASRSPVPSAPGDSPARRTGRLMESHQVLKRATVRDPTALVGHEPSVFLTEGPYPVFLEFGTRRMAPRPYIRPSLDVFRKRYG